MFESDLIDLLGDNSGNSSAKSTIDNVRSRLDVWWLIGGKRVAR